MATAAPHQNDVTLDQKFGLFRRLLELCEARGYDPLGASLQETMRYRGMNKYRAFDKNGKLYWALAWEQPVDWEEFGPQSGAAHPAILFLSGREEWHDGGRLHRIGGPAVVTSKGTEKFFVRDVEDTTVTMIKPARKTE